MYILLKFGVSAAVLVAVSELAKRSALAGGLLASLPLVSILAMLWLYCDTGDAGKVADLSTSIFWLVLPSLVLFLVLPRLLRAQVPFYPALAIACIATVAGYGMMLFALPRFGIEL